jgi:hypothetical protein
MKAFVVYIDSEEISAADLRVAIILGADSVTDTEPDVFVEQVAYDGYGHDVRVGDSAGPKGLGLRYMARPLNHGYADDNEPF